MENLVVRYADGQTWYTYLVLAKSFPLVPPWTGCAQAVIEPITTSRKVHRHHLVLRGGSAAALKKAVAHLDSLHPGLMKTSAPLPMSNEGPAPAPETSKRL